MSKKIWRLTVRDEISAGHALRHYEGKCERLHGHNFAVELTVEGDKLTENVELLLDFKVLKRALKEELAAKMAADICRRYKIDAGDLRNLSYFASSSLSYINYLRGLGYLEAYIEDNQIFYRRTPASYERKEQKREAVLPKTGQFR